MSDLFGGVPEYSGIEFPKQDSIFPGKVKVSISCKEKEEVFFLEDVEVFESAIGDLESKEGLPETDAPHLFTLTGRFSD